MARVFVAVDGLRGIVGFYSLSSWHFAIADLPPEHASRSARYDAIPAALTGRLARDEKVRGEGVGDLLLADAVRRVIGASRSLAVFAIVVEATDEKAAAFYRDFRIRAVSEQPPLRLFMPLVRSGGGCFPARCFGSCRSLSLPNPRLSHQRVSGRRHYLGVFA